MSVLATVCHHACRTSVEVLRDWRVSEQVAEATGVLRTSVARGFPEWPVSQLLGAFWGALLDCGLAAWNRESGWLVCFEADIPGGSCHRRFGDRRASTWVERN